MNIVNCTWEQMNLGENVCEVTVSSNEAFCFDIIKALEKDYTYQVVKVEAGNVPFILELQKLGFVLIETQLDWTTKMKDFNQNHPLIERFRPILTFQNIKSEEEFNKMLSMIDNNMFSTDRIALDPKYGMAVGRNRYCNWMQAEYSLSKSYFAYIIVEGTKVGFLMLRNNNGRAHGALAGIFKEYQDLGFGILTSSSMPLYILDMGLGFKHYETSTSSNNTANTKIYSTLGFQLKSMHYVFIKHTA